MKQEAQDKEMSFEEALAELESIVQKLETGQVKLDESVRFYERGIFLRNFCNRKLSEAKSKIDLLQTDANGNIVSKESFDDKIV